MAVVKPNGIEEKNFLFFTEVARMDVADSNGRTAGRIQDLALSLGDGSGSSSGQPSYPRATHLVLRRGRLARRYASLPWDQVASIQLHLHLRVPAEEIPFQDAPPAHDFLLVRDILDQQVVDRGDQKVIRVNDVHLLLADNLLYLSHVDVGLRGIVRRLGWEWFVDRFVEVFLPRSQYFRENFISWRYITPLALQPPGRLKLSVGQSELQRLPRTSIHDILLEMDSFRRAALFQSIPPEFRPGIFQDLDITVQRELLENLDLKEASHLLSRIPADQATDLLEEIPSSVAESLLAQMETHEARKLSTLLGYSSDSAGGLMTTEFLTLPRDATAAEALARIREYPHELPHQLYLVDEENRLSGVVPLRNILPAVGSEGGPHVLLKDLALARVPYVRAKDSLREVAFLMDKYKIPSVPVVNSGKEKLLQGIITSDDILRRLIPLAWRRRAKLATPRP